MIKIKRLFKSFSYAFNGLFKTIHEEQNLQIQTIVSALVLLLAYFLKINRIEWCLLCIVISLVILAEIINSAAERIADVLKPRINSYVKEIKDIMAAAVMVASFLSIIVGVIIFFPYFLKFLN